MPYIREGHPELAADFAVLDDFFNGVQASKLERTKRVLARCCFLWHAEIPAEIINAGERSGGGIDNSICVPGPDEDEEYDPPHYVSDWLGPIEAAGLLIKNASPSFSASDNQANPVSQHITPPNTTYNMPATTQRALTLLLAATSPALLFTAFHTVLLSLRSLYPGRLPASSPTALTTPLRLALSHHINHITLAYTHHLSLVPFVDPTSALRTLQSLLNDLGWYYIHTSNFPGARDVGRAALRLSGHPNQTQPPAPEDELSRQVFNLNLDTLLLNAWAWAWMSPGEHSAEFLDGYLTHAWDGFAEEFAFDEDFMRGVYTAMGFWEQGVEMLGGEGPRGRGEAVGRIQGTYGEGRRMRAFWVVEEGYNWERPVIVKKKRKRRGEAGGQGWGKRVEGGRGEVVGEDEDGEEGNNDGRVGEGENENEDEAGGQEGSGDNRVWASQDERQNAALDEEFWLLVGEEENGNARDSDSEESIEE